MSLLPPILPPQVVARTRIKALSADLAREADPSVRAAVTYEIGALHELRLDDIATAYAHYREASELDPNFRPPLFALRRLLRDSRDQDELLRVLAKIISASTLPSERAMALVELGSLLEDQLGDPAGAKNAFERALVADPSCLAACLMLERSLLAQNHLSEAHALIASHVPHTTDAKLHEALACEAAEELGARGQVDAAIELLLGVLALPGRHLATLLQLNQLAQRHDRPAIAAQACEDLASMLAAYAAGNIGTDAPELAVRFPEAAAAAQAAACFYSEAGRLHAAMEEHAAEAAAAYDRALSCARDDVHLRLEAAAAYEAAGDLTRARETLHGLLERASPRRVTALQFQLAELAEREGDSKAAVSLLQAARALAPDAPVVAAVLEDRLIDARQFDALSELLLERARRTAAADREAALLRAALSAERTSDPTRAFPIYAELAQLARDKTPVLREAYGLAMRCGAPAKLREIGAQLLTCDIDHAEHSAIMRACYEAALAEKDSVGSRTLLRSALEEPACQLWAAHSAWAAAALHADRELLSLAHEKLAELAERSGDNELAAAHLAAQGRNLVRADSEDLAVTRLRRALELSPTHPYAVGLLEDCLIARGDASEAVHLLRDAAAAERDSGRGESALLHAAQAAEHAGHMDLARSSYDQAAERDPLAFAALWARLRFAERNSDSALRLAALRALAERETALERPGAAQLEYAEALYARADYAGAVAPLTAAMSNDSTSFEAAATTALLPHRAGAGALRSRALSFLAEHTGRPARAAFEHERVAELVHVAATDARTLLSARQNHAASEASDALLAWFLCDTEPERADALTGLSTLSQEPAVRAEFLLHAQRTRSSLGQSPDADALVAALTAFEEAPDSLAAALALDEVLSPNDDADARVSALKALVAHAGADELKSALARTLLEAGDAAEAELLAEQLIAANPDDLSAWAVLRIAAHHTQNFERLVHACDRLAQAATGSLRASLLEEAAAVLHERLGRADEAELRLRTALDTLPERKPAFERLHDVLVERENLAGLIALLAKRIGVTGSEAERVDLMYERARIVRASGDREAALQCAKELLASAPQHPGALGLCAEIYTSLEDFPAAISTLRALSQTEIPAGQRRLAREGAADFLDDKLRQPAAAYRELEPLLETDWADLSLHTRMADLAQRASLMQEAAQSLTRAAAACRGSQRATFERRAASIQLETLGQPEVARATLARALLADPSDCEAFEALLAATSSADERANVEQSFLETLWGSLAREPAEAQHLRALARVGRVTGHVALEQVALSALAPLGLATTEEASAATGLLARVPSTPRRGLEEQSFQLLVPLAANSALMRFARAASNACLYVRPDSAEQHGVDRRVRVAKRAAHPVRDALQQWLSAFGIELSDMYVSASEPRALYPVLSAGYKQSWIVGREVTAPLSVQTRLTLAPLAAATRAGLLPLVYANPIESRELLLAALSTGGGGNQTASTSRIQELLDRKLSRALRQQLTAAVAALDDKQLALTAIGDAVRTLSLRARAIAAGDIGVAFETLGGKERNLEAILGSKHAFDLLRFWVSPRSVRVLQTLGAHP